MPFFTLLDVTYRYETQPPRCNFSPSSGKSSLLISLHCDFFISFIFRIESLEDTSATVDLGGEGGEASDGRVGHVHMHSSISCQVASRPTASYVRHAMSSSDTRDDVPTQGKINKRIHRTVLQMLIIVYHCHCTLAVSRSDWIGCLLTARYPGALVHLPGRRCTTWPTWPRSHGIARLGCSITKGSPICISISSRWTKLAGAMRRRPSTTST